MPNHEQQPVGKEISGVGGGITASPLVKAFTTLGMHPVGAEIMELLLTPEPPPQIKEGKSG